MKKLLKIITVVMFFFGVTFAAYAQIVPAQNQQILSPYGGFIVATSSTATSKLSATSTPFFSQFSANAGTINGNFTVTGTCTGCGSGSGTVGSGTTGQFPYYAGAGTTLTATSSLFVNTNQDVSIGTTTFGAGFALTVSNNDPSNGANVLKLVNTRVAGTGGGGGIQDFTGVVPTAQGDRLGFLTFGYTPGVNGETNRNAAGVFGYANQAWTPGSAQGSYLTFETTADNAASRTAAMTITGAGFVGIGTTSPQAQFDSQTNSNANITLAQFKNYSAGAAAIATFNMVNDNGGSFGLQQYSSGNTLTQNSYGGAIALAGMSRLRSSLASNGLVIGSGGAKPTIFITNDNEAMRIQSGTVAGALIGIGTSSPYAKLSIHANPAETNTALFVIASSTATATTTLFSIDNIGNASFKGTGTTTFASGTGLTMGNVFTLMGSTGKIGIGTGAVPPSTLGSPIEIVSTGAGIVSSALTLGNASNVANSGTALDFDVEPTIGAGNFFARIAAVRTNVPVNTDTDFVFSVRGNSILSEAMRIKNSGNMGIATSSPFATLSVHAPALGTNTTLFAIGSSTATATTTLFMVDNNGHQFTGGSAPVLSSCGTSPSFVGAANDTTMSIQVGSVAATGCTATFAVAWPTAPTCNVTNRSMSVANAMTYTISATAIVVTQTGLTSAILDIRCQGTQ